MANAFSGFREAKVFEHGQFFQPGSYVVSVDKCILKQTFKSGLCFIAEFDIVESNNPERPVGSRSTWIIPLDKRREIAMSNLKGFLVAALGRDKNIDKTWYEETFQPNCEDLMNKVVDDNALQGVHIALEAVNVASKNNPGGEYLRCDWRAYKSAEDSASAAQ